MSFFKKLFGGSAQSAFSSPPKIRREDFVASRAAIISAMPKQPDYYFYLFELDNGKSFFFETQFIKDWKNLKTDFPSDRFTLTISDVETGCDVVTAIEVTGNYLEPIILPPFNDEYWAKIGQTDVPFTFEILDDSFDDLLARMQKWQLSK